jgi:hypothetical protein
VFIAELCGAYKPRHTYLRRFPLVLILAAELARFRWGTSCRGAYVPLGSLQVPSYLLQETHTGLSTPVAGRVMTLLYVLRI